MHNRVQTMEKLNTTTEANELIIHFGTEVNLSISLSLYSPGVVLGKAVGAFLCVCVGQALSTLWN